MNKSDEIVYLGRLISLLGKHEQLTLGEIKSKTRPFLRKRHQTDSSLFNTLESFCKLGVLRRKVHKSRIYYALDELGAPKQPATPDKAAMLEMGVDTESELFKQMANQALRYMGKKPLNTSPISNEEEEEENLDRTKVLEYKPKEAPPNDVKGFK